MDQPARTPPVDVETLLRSRDQFLRSVSHELRTPVAVTLVWANLLREGKVPQEQIPHALAAIEQSARDQKRLVDLLGDAARVSSGRITLHRAANEIAPLIRESLELIADQAQAKGVTIEDAITDVGSASIDADRVRQALSHLLSNALRHTPKDGRITVATTGGDETVSISVRDTGSGIDPRLLPHLFAPTLHAVRATIDEERGGAGGGLGLGLQMASRLAALHGGAVTATSDGPGRGTQVVMTLARA